MLKLNLVSIYSVKLFKTNENTCQLRIIFNIDKFYLSFQYQSHFQLI